MRLMRTGQPTLEVMMKSRLFLTCIGVLLLIGCCKTPDTPKAGRVIHMVDGYKTVPTPTLYDCDEILEIGDRVLLYLPPQAKEVRHLGGNYYTYKLTIEDKDVTILTSFNITAHNRIVVSVTQIK